MWKLFPDAWLQEGPFAHQRAANAAALRSNWRSWLDVALSRLKGVTVSTNRTQTLRALKGSDLLALDLRIRAALDYNRPLQTPADPDDESETDAYLFVASCHTNGYIRERALIAFRERGGPLAFAAGLVRSTDWVPAVRNTAISLAEELVPQLPAEEVVRYLDLAVSLQGRLRVSETLWRGSITRKLTAPPSRDALLAATRDMQNSRVLRHAAYEFLIRHESEPRLPTLEQAIGDSDPVISRWAFDRSTTLLTVEEHSMLVRGALRHAHASVRQRALRAYLALSPADAAETLRAALLDSSRGMRALAAFELRARFSESPLPIWRAALVSSSRSRVQAATVALCEAGEREDVERLSERAGPQNAQVRAALLRGLERVDSDRLQQHLRTALFDESGVVLRQAAEIYRRSGLPPEPALLQEALGKANAKHVPAIMALSGALRPWDALEFVLREAVENDPVRAECAAENINAWCGGSQKALPTASAEQAARLRQLLLAAQARHRDRNWGLLELLMRTQL